MLRLWDFAGMRGGDRCPVSLEGVREWTGTEAGRSRVDCTGRLRRSFALLRMTGLAVTTAKLANGGWAKDFADFAGQALQGEGLLQEGFLGFS